MLKQAGMREGEKPTKIRPTDQANKDIRCKYSWNTYIYN